MNSGSRVETHFVYRANACGAGGRFTRVGDIERVYDIPVQSSLSLPVTGGRGMSVFPGYAPCDGGLNLFLSGPIICQANTQADEKSGATRTHVSAEAREVRVHGGLEIPYVKGALEASSVGRDAMADIRTADCVLSPIHLGHSVVTAQLDNDTFRRCDTMAEIEKEFANRKDIVRTNKGVLVASIVKSVSLAGGEDKRIRLVQPNKIYWQDFGWIILGEILISAQYRRLTMVRLELGSPVEGSAAVGEVESDGHTVP